MKSRTLKIFGSTLLAFVLFCAFVWWWLWSVPVSDSKLKQLTPGMSKSEVISVIGSASETNQAAGGETWLIYSHRPSIVALIVIFDNTDHFIKYVVD